MGACGLETTPRSGHGGSRGWGHGGGVTGETPPYLMGKSPKTKRKRERVVDNSFCSDFFYPSFSPANKKRGVAAAAPHSISAMGQKMASLRVHEHLWRCICWKESIHPCWCPKNVKKNPENFAQASEKFCRNVRKILHKRRKIFAETSEKYE